MGYKAIIKEGQNEGERREALKKDDSWADFEGSRF
jgi:hypothetical protein